MQDEVFCAFLNFMGDVNTFCDRCILNKNCKPEKIIFMINVGRLESGSDLVQVLYLDHILPGSHFTWITFYDSNIQGN